MEDFVAERGLHGDVVFPGYVTMREMVALLSASDIYVSSSRADAGLAASTAEEGCGSTSLMSDNSENRSGGGAGICLRMVVLKASPKELSTWQAIKR